MAAPTNTYCSYATGNDYKGASFTDGAYTSATKTLIKAGAFAASKVNHWLYLESNDGGSIVAGYYKIATATDANTVVLATDAGAGVDDDAAKCTQHDGTTSLPWRSVQGALDLITRDATNGDQVNVKAGTAQVSQAALALTTYGTPSANVPIIMRGYTASAGDGGIGEIDCNGASFWAASNYTGFVLADLEVHNFGNNQGIQCNTNGQCIIYHCEVHKGASSPTSKYLLIIGGGICIYSYVHDAGTTGFGISGDATSKAYRNYVKDCPYGIVAGTIIGNIVVDCTVNALRSVNNCSLVAENSVFSSTASTGIGISWATNIYMTAALNNIIEGYSGAGGDAIYGATADMALTGYNAFFNNTNNRNLDSDLYIDLGGDVAIAGATSPFTNAGAGDFSLNTEVAGAIDGAFPGAWYGPAGTTDHADIGAVQMPAGSGGVSVRHPRGLWIMR